MHRLPGGTVNIAVYTTIFGGYDELVAPVVVGDADYICFTDKWFDAPEPWQVQVVEPPHPDPRKAARYYITQSTLVLPEHQYTVMHGGNAALKVPPEALLEYVRDTDIAAFKHPHRDNVYFEPFACAQLDKDTMEHMQPQMARYREEGFPGLPFSACTLLVRRNSQEIEELELLWWSEIQGGSHRDQLSFDYCRWKLFVPITYIPGDCFVNPILERHAHYR